MDKLSFWKLGPLSLYAEREEFLWHIGTAHDAEDSDGTAPHRFITAEDVDPQAKFERVVAPSPDLTLSLRPRLADRSVVARPDEPFFVPPGSAVTVFIGTPVWLSLEADDTVLKEFPIVRPSDTWFGPTTEGGELCYASRTRCRTVVDDIAQLPHRAITAVRIDNRATTALSFERVSLPAARLALYAAKDGRFWTEQVDFRRAENTDFAELSIRDGAPEIDPDAQLVSQPRKPHEHAVIRAFSSLLS